MNRIALPAAVLVALALAAACGTGSTGDDAGRDASPRPEVTGEAQESEATPWQPVAGLPDDAYAEIGRAVPGFAGLYIGNNIIGIDLVDPTKQAEAEEAIARVFKEFFGEDVFAGDPTVRVRKAEIPYLDLYNWRLTLRSALFGPEGGVLGRPPLITSLGIDDRAKKIGIGVPDEENIPKVEAILAEHGIPREAVEFRIMPTIGWPMATPNPAYILP
jgi:hypothetical protein